MKKIIAFLIAIIIILSTTFILVINKNNELNSVVEKQTDITNENTNTSLQTTEKITTEEVTEEITTVSLFKTDIEKKVNEEISKIENENTEAWKQAYIEFLDNYYSETNEEKIWLGYIDDDDIPELFISEGTFHYCTVRIYTFQNNFVTFLCETGSNGNVNYFERQGILCGFYSGTGVGNYWIYNIDNGKIQEIYYAYTNENYVPLDEEIELDININGIDVSSEELDKFLDYYFNEDNSIWIFNEYDADYSKYEFNKDAYTSYINNF